MRNARATEGLCVDGETIRPYRSPDSVRAGSVEELSFKDWDIQQPIPEYQDHISGHHLQRPDHPMFPIDDPKPLGYPTVQPNDPLFGPPSVVKVPYRSAEKSGDQTALEQPQLELRYDINDNNITRTRPKRSKPHPLAKTTIDSTEPTRALRRPVKQRWYYETVPTPALATHLDKYEAAITMQPEAARYPSKCENGVQDFVPPEWSVCGLPESLGVMEHVTDAYLESLPMNEIGAQMLQGLLFHEHDLLWCRITGWGVENSIPMVFYSPILADDIVRDEEYASLGEIVALLRQSECAPVIPKFEPSRVLRLSESFRRNLCYKQLSYKATYPDLPSIGYSAPAVSGVPVGSYNGMVLTDKIIKRILRAQETIFKYGTLIPRNDACRS
jgi:hypothetical protein